MTSKKSKCATVKFEVGERILCYQDSHIYEAKCLQVKKVGSTFRYYVHYRNFKSKFDEWVPYSRVLKYNDANLKLKQELVEKSKAKEGMKESKLFKKKKLHEHYRENKMKLKKKLKKSSSLESTSTSVNTTFQEDHDLSTKKIETPPHVETQQEFIDKYEVKIEIPEDLKNNLIDDWEMITIHNKILHFPVKYSIDKILNDFYFSKTQTSKLPLNHTLEGYVQFISNIRRYFNFFLEKRLLYASEREQVRYLIENYDDFISVEHRDNNTHKEFRRSWKKQRKSNVNRNVGYSKISSVLNNDDSSIEMQKPSCSKASPSSGENSTPEESDSNLTNEAHELNLTGAGQSSFMNLKEEGPKALSTTQPDKKKDLTKLFGPEHLLRLFSQMGQLIFYTDLTLNQMILTNTYTYDFLKYLSKNAWLFERDSDTAYVDASLFINNK